MKCIGIHCLNLLPISLEILVFRVDVGRKGN